MTDDHNSGSKSNKTINKESELERTAKSFRSGWAYAEYAFQYGVTIILCALIGYWLDNWLHTKNVLLIIGVFFGSFAGFVYLIKSLNRKKK